MHKIGLIIKREYLSRVKKKSFIIMTFLGPILIASVYGIAIWFAINSDDVNDKKVVTVVDENHLFSDKLKNSKTITFSFSDETILNAKKEFKNSGNNYILYIPKLENALTAKGIELYAEKQPSLTVVNYIENAIKNSLEDQQLIEHGIDKKILETLKADVQLNTIRITEKGEQNSSAGASYGIGFFAAFLIYLFIFLYGVQVMRGVIEEKNNRIVEVIISSVKPFQLMMGKIIGVALVGLTQFALWVVLTGAITGAISSQIGNNSRKIKEIQEQAQSLNGVNQQVQNDFNKAKISEVMNAIQTINFPLIIACFLFYFLAGYLLYSALFAAIGSAVDSEAETQQFMFPITIPLIFAIVMSTSVIINNPDGTIAVWLSLIPLTSPVVMMIRLPFGVPTWQLLTSMILLVLGFLGTVWIASRIYRTGILMYGKKVTLKEIGKWLFYKA